MTLTTDERALALLPKVDALAESLKDELHRLTIRYVRSGLLDPSNPNAAEVCFFAGLREASVPPGISLATEQGIRNLSHV